MTTHWGVDLGTSNTTICEDRTGDPRIVHLPGLASLEPLTQTSGVELGGTMSSPKFSKVACRSNGMNVTQRSAGMSDNRRCTSAHSQIRCPAW